MEFQPWNGTSMFRFIKHVYQFVLFKSSTGILDTSHGHPNSTSKRGINCFASNCGSNNSKPAKFNLFFVAIQCFKLYINRWKRIKTKHLRTFSRKFSVVVVESPFRFLKPNSLSGALPRRIQGNCLRESMNHHESPTQSQLGKRGVEVR